MKEELLKIFDKIDNMLKNGDYILFEVAIALYERCDDISVVENLTENEIQELRRYVSSTSIISEDVSDKIDEML